MKYSNYFIFDRNIITFSLHRRVGSRYMLRPSKSIPSNWHPIRDRKGADDDDSPARDRLPERLSLHDYVGLLNDILRAGKNLALCRHFDALNKEHIIRSGACRHLAVLNLMYFSSLKYLIITFCSYFDFLNLYFLDVSHHIELFLEVKHSR